MKGASRIISETLLFAIGIAITAFVILQFSVVENNIGSKSFEGQMSSVSNSVMNALKSVQGSENAYVELEIPAKLVENDYTISLLNEPKKLLIISNSRVPSENFVREIFNIKQGDIVSGSVASGSRYIAIRKVGTTNSGSKIMLQRR